MHSDRCLPFDNRSAGWQVIVVHQLWGHELGAHLAFFPDDTWLRLQGMEKEWPILAMKLKSKTVILLFNTPYFKKFY
jgi:hypothetical protein